MNNKRRIVLCKCIEVLRDISSKVEEVKSEEEDVRDNTPDSLQETERYEICETACDALDDAYDLVQETIEKLEEIDGVSA